MFLLFLEMKRGQRERDIGHNRSHLKKAEQDGHK